MCIVGISVIVMNIIISNVSVIIIMSSSIHNISSIMCCDACYRLCDKTRQRTTTPCAATELAPRGTAWHSMAQHGTAWHYGVARCKSPCSWGGIVAKHIVSITLMKQHIPESLYPRQHPTCNASASHG